MTLDDFMTVTRERLPSAAELIAVCEEIGVEFGTDAEGRPALKYRAWNKEESILLAKLIRREPWRSQVIAAKGLSEPKPTAPPREFYWRDGHRDTEHTQDARFGDPTHAPTGAWWWRVRGETQWRPVPGRGGEHEAPPETHP